MAAKTAVKGTKFLVSTGPKVGATPKSIDSITATNPPVVESTAHGLTNGAVISLKNTGDEGLDTVYIIEVIDVDSFYLANADWSMRTTLTGIATLTATELATSQFCDLTTLAIADLEVSYATEQTLCDEITEATTTFGTISADGTWAPEAMLQKTLEEYRRSQEKFMLLIQPPKVNAIFGWRVMQSKFDVDGSAEDTKFSAAFEWKVDSQRGLVELI